LTSTNVSLLASPQPEKRKVGGSIPLVATMDLSVSRFLGPAYSKH